MIRVVECTLRHVGMMCLLMRDEDRREVVALCGPDVRKAIRRCYHMSVVRKAALIDGELAAIWGVTGTLIAGDCSGWLLTTPQLAKRPISIFREARRQLDELMETRSAIQGQVAADYKAAIDFLWMLGFSMGVPRPIGRNGEMFRVVSCIRGSL